MGYNNLPVDRRLANWGNGGITPTTWGPSRKGGLVSEDLSSSFAFHYNPSTVDVSHQFNDQTASAYLSAATDPGNNGPGGIPKLVALSQTTVSFTLLLDRTYELWDGDRSVTNGAHQGVWHDIVTLYQMVGIIQGTDLTKMLPLQYWTGFLLLDGKSALNIGSPTLYGYLGGLDYELTHWTYDMIPIRATMSIVWNLLPNVSSNTGRTLQSNGTGTPSPSLASFVGAAVLNTGPASPTWASLSAPVNR